MAGNFNSGQHGKTIEQLKANGTYRPDRHGDHVGASESPAGHPEKPKSLTGDASKEWDRMVRRLESCKTLSLVDDAAIYQYAMLFSETESFAASMKDNQKFCKLIEDSMSSLTGTALLDAISRMVDVKKIMMKQSISIRQGRMAIRQYLVEFGQTPASRSRVHIAKKSEHKSRLLTFNGGNAAPKSDSENEEQS